MPGKFILIEGTKSSYYYDGRCSIGAYVHEGKAILIDSGIDKGTAKEVNKAIKALGFTVGAIINTHYHADHCGGNAFFQQSTPDLKIYATTYEKKFIEDKMLEPSTFCCGAEPIEVLAKSKLITTEKSSTVTDEIKAYKDQSLEVLGIKLGITTLPGHTSGMIGVITPDNILYCGDALYGAETYKKHGILFYTNLKNTMATFDKLAKLQIKGCVFYHGGYQEGSLEKVAQDHRKKVMESINFINEKIKESQGKGIDQLTQTVMNEFKIDNKPEHFILTRTCVHACVQALEQNNNLYMDVRDGLLQAKHVVSTKTLPFYKSQIESKPDEASTEGFKL